ncbi:marine proteobacterial sortase target protein [Agarivorans sp.]|uniref:marine proteobacterial sortase target protein n=1 Tax=Agarivorans sp. TaxID=1872412 RepID=UPI003D05A494
MNIRLLSVGVGLCRGFCLAGVASLFWATSSGSSQAAQLEPPLPEATQMAGLRYLDANGQPRYNLPLHSEVKMQVAGLTNRVMVNQTFVNNSEDWIDGSYMFPLPNNAAVDSMQLLIGERKIEGQILQKKLAKKRFDEAKQQGKRASLVEQLRPNIFTTAVANLAPGEHLSVTISYQQQVEYQDGVFSFRLPMLVNPRYTPPQIFADSHARLSHGEAAFNWSFASLLQQQPEFNASSGWLKQQLQLLQHSAELYARGTDNRGLSLDLNINLNPGFELARLDSLYHKMTSLTRSDGSIDIQVENTLPNKDFVLSWQPIVGARPEAALYTQRGLSHSQAESGAQHDYALLMLMPPQGQAAEALELARELILVIDTSGSMSGQSISQAREALHEALSGLSAKDRFNIIEFNSYVRAMATQPLAVNASNLRRARAFVNSLHADGGTQMYPAIEAALARTEQAESSPEALRQVIFITDGAVSNEQALFDLIRNNLADSRFFTIGIGSAPNSHFMQRAAELGKGTFSYIGKQSEVKQQVTELFNKISHPVVRDIKLQFADGTVPEYWPVNIPDLYLGQPVMVSMKIPSGSQQQVVVSGEIQGQYWQRSLNLRSSQRSAGLDLLWARQYIAALELHKSAANERRVEQQVLALALKYHLVSSQTSLVAVDVTPHKPQGLESLQHRVSSGMPDGWLRPAMLPQTATSSRLSLALGALLTLLSLLVYYLTRYTALVQRFAA